MELMEGHSEISSLDPADLVRNQKKVDGYAEKILERLNSYLENFLLCDVVLVSGVDGTRISAHRLVLSAASDYFAAMFTGSMREKKESQIIMNEVQGDVLQNLVHFCYTGKVDISENTVQTLLTTASLLQFDSVVELCIPYVLSKLQPENCLGIALLAETHSFETLSKKAKSYIYQHFVEVSKTEEFAQLNLNQLSELLSSDDINASLEQDVLKSLIFWLQYDLATRDKPVPELMNLVRLPLLEPDFVDEYLEQPCDSTVLNLLRKELIWQVLQPIEYSSDNTYDCIKLRKSTIFGRHLLVFGYTEALFETPRTLSVSSYYPRLDKWKFLDELSLPVVKDFDVAVLNGHLLIVGGRNSANYISNDMHAFDLKNILLKSKFENYTTLKPMNEARFAHGVAVLNGYLYAVGGHNNLSDLATVERWDPVLNSWSYIASMFTSRSYAGICVLDGCLYVVGGEYDNKALCAVECFDPHKNEWTFKTELNECRKNLHVVAASGYYSGLLKNANSNIITDGKIKSLLMAF